MVIGRLKPSDFAGRPTFLGFAAAALISVGHSRDWLSLAALPEWVAVGANLLAIVLGVASLPWLLKGLAWPYRAYMRRQSRDRQVEDAMETLTVEEALVFWSMVSEGRRTTFAEVGGPGMGAAYEGLVNRGLLQPGAPVAEGWTLRIPPHVHELVRDEQEYAQAAVRKVRALMAERRSAPREAQ